MTALFVKVLQWIYSWVGNYGWSVVVFTLFVRVVLLPLDIKSKKSMRAMQAIQPKVNALQKKYANDKDKLNLKLNELYRKEHVSPTAGCLPLLISLPILWFMFAAMRQLANEKTIEMILRIRDTGVVPTGFESWLWIKNVFQPDSFGTSILPAVGDTLKSIAVVKSSSILTAENIEAARAFLASTGEVLACNGQTYAQIAGAYCGQGVMMSIPLNLLLVKPTLVIPTSFSNLLSWSNGWFILPVAAAVSQFFMTALTSGNQKKKEETDIRAQEEDSSAQAASNAMNSGFMKWFFPIFSLWICASYTAAFAIYWMAANVIQIGQQFFVNLYFDRLDKKKAQESDTEIK